MHTHDLRNIGMIHCMIQSGVKGRRSCTKLQSVGVPTLICHHAIVRRFTIHPAFRAAFSRSLVALNEAMCGSWAPGNVTNQIQSYPVTDLQWTWRLFPWLLGELGSSHLCHPGADFCLESMGGSPRGKVESGREFLSVL